MEAADGSKSKAAAASGGVEASAAADKTPAAGRMTKLVKVEQQFIDSLLVRPKINIDRLARGTLFDARAEVLVDDPEVEEMRAEAAATVAFVKKLNDVNEDILAQYKEKGYAMGDGSEELLCMH